MTAGQAEALDIDAELQAARREHDEAQDGWDVYLERVGTPRERGPEQARYIAARVRLDLAEVAAGNPAPSSPSMLR